MSKKTVKNALISVFYKDNLEPIIAALVKHNVNIYSTGGTEKFLKEQGVDVHRVEDLTSYPSILGGRVKTLHPKVFGGILSRRDNEQDQQECVQYEIPDFDLVVVDLYPFEETVASSASEQDIIEKIDIGGISLIRAAAKNFKDVAVVSSRNQYAYILEILESQECSTTLEQRKELAGEAFNISSHYDTSIHQFFSPHSTALKISEQKGNELRYGENPHQKGEFFGDLKLLFDKLHGKELSYNNLLDVDAAVHLMAEFSAPTFAILKHNNACGVATRDNIFEAFTHALAGDPVSAFGGILIANREIDAATAEEINKIFCEVVIAPTYQEEALAILKSKKNRIILVQKEAKMPDFNVRTTLNGYLVQEKDASSETKEDLKTATETAPTEEQIPDLIFANTLAKHTKSNTIVLAKNNQLIASGTGQTSRVDALKQAINKAKSFNFDLRGAVMASDAFFPFPDCVEIADKEGIKAVIQPGGSIKDQASIDYCNANNIAMVFTGVRHFKH